MLDPNARRPDLLPAIVLLAIIVVIGGAIWLFPYMQAYVQRQECVAAGRVDCG